VTSLPDVLTTQQNVLAVASRPTTASLRKQLERERARSAGLERGIVALTRRVDELREENAVLRAQLGDAALPQDPGGDR
jgi:hypothetical protein